MLIGIVRPFKSLLLKCTKNNKTDKMRERENEAFDTILRLFKENETLIFADFHASKMQHQVFADIVDYLISKGEKFDVFLEYKTCYQKTMDGVLKGKVTYNEAFEFKPAPKGSGYESIVDACRKNAIKIVCFDANSEYFDVREKHMADMILNSSNKAVVMVGAKHLLKTKHSHLYSCKNIKYIKMHDYSSTLYDDKSYLYNEVAKRSKHKIIRKSTKPDYDFDIIIPENKEKKK